MQSKHTPNQKGLIKQDNTRNKVAGRREIEREKGRKRREREGEKKKRERKSEIARVRKKERL